MSRNNLSSLIIGNDLGKLRQKLKAGADVNGTIGDLSPLQRAAWFGNLAAVRLLLEFGADVSLNSRKYPETAVHYATFGTCTSESYEICKLLLENGANPNDHRDRSSVTPLMRAIEYKNLRVAQLLVDHGADSKAVDYRGWTILHYAAESGDVDAILFALKQGIGIERVDNNDCSALYVATEKVNLEACEILLKRGAMVNRKNRRTGHSAITLLVSEESRLYATDRANVLQVLLEYGAQVADKINRMSCLEIAAEETGSEPIRNVLTQHVARMKYLNLAVNENDLRTIEDEDCYNEYYQRCLQEIGRMSGAKVRGDVSALDIFTASKKVMSAYAKIKDLVGALERNDYHHRFPIYFRSLKKVLDTEVTKHKLRRSAATILSVVFNLNDSFHPVNQEILRFLSDKDLDILNS